MSVINLFKKSRKSEFTLQIRPHLQSLYRQAYRLVGNPDDAEDLVQDLLIQLYEKNVDLNLYEKPASWLLRALYNLFVDQYRKKSRLPIDNKESDSDQIIDSMSDEMNSPHSLMVQQHSRTMLETIIKSLNQEQQVLISMHDIEGHTLLELSEVMNTPIGTLKSRLHRARQALREKIDPELFSKEPLSENIRVTQ
jgi:RNA polymerase sigma-70 factor (ECF subfamily)